MVVAKRPPPGVSMTQTISSQSSQKTTGSGSTLPTSGWPSPTDFSDAIQNPRSAFLDPTLQECTVERRPTGRRASRSHGHAQRTGERLTA